MVAGWRSVIRRVRVREQGVVVEAEHVGLDLGNEGVDVGAVCCRGRRREAVVWQEVHEAKGTRGARCDGRHPCCKLRELALLGLLQGEP